MSEGPAADAAARVLALRELLAVPPTERESRLRAMQDSDPVHAAMLRGMLADLLSGTQAEGAAPADDSALKIVEAQPTPASTEPVQQIGPYRLLRSLGAGAMGEVWLAEQQHPRRQVALKLLRGGVGSGELLARFVREANLLGRVEHPAIARVYAAGSAEGATGPVPYLAMEYVEGEDLGAWQGRARPTPQRVLQLLATLARAVHHAHLRGVIHRDLKPDNVLVDAAGEPKILDFGVARALDDDNAGMTQHGQLVGTLAYMSPEQLAGDLRQIDARSDVYALGAIGYELLAGQPVHELSGQSLLEALRARDRIKARPLGQLRPELRGDIEAVIMKALADEPSQRYDSAAALADDLDALLADRSVQARAPSRRETLARLLRRHRLAFATAALVLLSLLAATLISLRAAQSEATARAEAESRTEVAEAVTGFLNELFESADPGSGLGADLTVRSLLDEAVRTLDREPPKRPEVEFALRELIGNTWRNLGEYPRAQGQLDAALALALQTPDVVIGDEALLQYQLAALALDQGEVQLAVQRLLALQARPDLSEALQLRVRAQLAHAPLVAADPAAAAEALTALLPEAARAPDDGGSDRLEWSVRQNLAIAQIQLGQFDEAVANLRQIISAKQTALGVDHPDVLRNESDLATALDQQGRWQEAAELLRSVHQRQVGLYGPDNLVAAGTLQNLAKILLERGQVEESGALFARIAPIIEAQLGLDHPQTLILRGLRAYQFEELGAIRANLRNISMLSYAHGRGSAV
jgi:eukaryotic-like serine/threonine-protein kinase